MSNASNLINVPYLPVLGPVHPSEINAELLDAIYESSRHDTLLEYDKANRWANHPAERIYNDGITHHERGMTIKAHTVRGDRYYLYGDTPLVTAPGTVITVSKKFKNLSENESCTVVFMDEYTAMNKQSATKNIRFAHELDSEMIEQLSELGDASTKSGFAMLIKNGLAVNREEPTLVYVVDNQVLGAIGPLTVLQDSRGIIRMLPCYFGVHDAARRQGVGADLWQATREWALEHGAQYKLLQAEHDSSAEHFYHAQHLKCLGYVYKKSQ